MKTYAIPDNILTAAVQLLNQMPALQSRAVLNAIEATVVQQDAAAARPLEPPVGPPEADIQQPPVAAVAPVNGKQARAKGH